MKKEEEELKINRERMKTRPESTAQHCRANLPRNCKSAHAQPLLPWHHFAVPVDLCPATTTSCFPCRRCFAQPAAKPPPPLPNPATHKLLLQLMKT
jgi:hypothetical protein